LQSFLEKESTKAKTSRKLPENGGIARAKGGEEVGLSKLQKKLSRAFGHKRRSTTIKRGVVREQTA